jgi:hypothetical protein
MRQNSSNMHNENNIIHYYDDDGDIIMDNNDDNDVIMCNDEYDHLIVDPVNNEDFDMILTAHYIPNYIGCNIWNFVHETEVYNKLMITKNYRLNNPIHPFCNGFNIIIKNDQIKRRIIERRLPNQIPTRRPISGWYLNFEIYYNDGLIFDNINFHISIHKDPARQNQSHILAKFKNAPQGQNIISDELHFYFDGYNIMIYNKDAIINQYKTFFQNNGIVEVDNITCAFRNFLNNYETYINQFQARDLIHSGMALNRTPTNQKKYIKYKTKYLELKKKLEII